MLYLFNNQLVGVIWLTLFNENIILHNSFQIHSNQKDIQMFGSIESIVGYFVGVCSVFCIDNSLVPFSEVLELEIVISGRNPI